jgi:hypothetical protein
MNFSLQAQPPGNYTDDVYGLFANKDSRVVTTIKETGSNEVVIEAILVGWLHVGTFQVALQYDDKVVVPIAGSGGPEIDQPFNATWTTGLSSFLWLNPKLKNVAGWQAIATGEVHPEESEPWMHILVGGNEYQNSNDTLQTGRIRQIFKKKKKKVSSTPLTNTTFTYYEKLSFPPARNQFSRGSYLYMTEILPDLINTYENVNVFTRRIPSFVKTIEPEVNGLNVTLNGLANSEGLTKLPPVWQVSGGLDWDIITSTGFIYSKNDVTLRIDEYKETLWINNTPYAFPNATEMLAGEFYRGGDRYFITSAANTANDSIIEMKETLLNLDRGDTYYAYAYMIYKFQTSDEYPALGERFEFIPGCSVPIITATNEDGEICIGANIMLYIENHEDYESYADVSYQWYRGTTVLTGETNPYLITDVDGDYYVEVIMTACTMESEKFTVSHTTTPFSNPPPVIAASNEDGTLCGDATVLLYVENADEYTDVDYQWYYNGVPISGADQSYFLADIAGDYQVEVITADCSMVSTTFTVTLSTNDFEYPLPELDATNGGIICSDANILIYITNIKDYEEVEDIEYIWYYNGLPLDEETDNKPFLVTNIAGIYHVEIKIDDCSAVSEKIEVFDSGDTFDKEKPEIAATHKGVLCADREVVLSIANLEEYEGTGATYQWFHDGAPIMPIATKDTCAVYDTGYYHVVVKIGGCVKVSDDFYVSYKPICGVIVAGTVFPFVKIEDQEDLNSLFPITVSIKHLPDPDNFSEFDLYDAPAIVTTNVKYYDGAFFIEGTPKNPGFLYMLNNYGYPIDLYHAIGVAQGAPVTTFLAKGQEPDNNDGVTVGYYMFEEIEEGDYILEIKRAGYVVRWLMIKVRDEDLVVEHRELIPGDMDDNLIINVNDSNNLREKMNIPGYFILPELFTPEAKYDLNSDGSISIYDLNLLIIYVGFRWYHYEDTREWLEELHIEY